MITARDVHASLYHATTASLTMVSWSHFRLHQMHCSSLFSVTTKTFRSKRVLCCFSQSFRCSFPRQLAFTSSVPFLSHYPLPKRPHTDLQQRRQRRWQQRQSCGIREFLSFSLSSLFHWQRVCVCVRASSNTQALDREDQLSLERKDADLDACDECQ